MARKKVTICLLRMIRIRDVLVQHPSQGQSVLREVSRGYILLGSLIAFVEVRKVQSCVGKSVAVSIPKRQAIKLYK
jgi:hypothetical protein